MKRQYPQDRSSRARVLMRRAAKRPARAGMTLIEVMVSVVVLTVCISLLSNTIAATVAQGVANRERALAVEAAQNIAEDMRRAPFDQIYALYNQDPTDDPGRAGTAPGAHFAVEGLSVQEGDQDGFAGRILLPSVAAVLREDLVVPSLGMPRDLNGDHLIDSKDHSNSYVVLPVSIRVEWTGRVGRREFELTTMFADFTRLEGAL